MSEKDYLIINFPEEEQIGDAVTAAMRRTNHRFSLLIRDKQLSPEDVSFDDLRILTIKRIGEIVTGEIVRFSGLADKCDVANEDDEITGWFDNFEGGGEITINTDKEA